MILINLYSHAPFAKNHFRTYTLPPNSFMSVAIHHCSQPYPQTVVMLSMCACVNYTFSLFQKFYMNEIVQHVVFCIQLLFLNIIFFEIHPCFFVFRITCEYPYASYFANSLVETNFVCNDFELYEFSIAFSIHIQVFSVDIQFYFSCMYFLERNFQVLW